MSTPEKLPNDYEIKDRYEFSCAKCGHEQMARPSIMMHGFGLNAGHGKCMECGTFLHLGIDTEKQVMISQDWDKWLALATTVELTTLEAALMDAKTQLEKEAAVSDPWVCGVCAQEFKNEADLLAHQFATSCEKELQETAVAQEVSA